MNSPVLSRFISIEAEKAILGTFLNEGHFYLDHLQILNSDYFADSKHKIIVMALKEMAKTEKPIEPFLLHEQLKNMRVAIQAGERPIIFELMECAVQKDIVDYYFNELIDYWKKRKIFLAASSIVQRMSKVDTPDSEKSIQLLENTLQEVKEGLSDDLLEDFNVGVDREIKEYEKYFNEGKVKYGALSGFKELDDILGGFNNGNLIVLAGRPAMGKTAFALQLMSNIHRNDAEKKPSAFFSLEMTKSEIYGRYISFSAKIPGDNVTHRVFNLDNFTKIYETRSRTNDQKLFACEKAGILLDEIQNECRKMKRKFGSMGAIFIDYLQLVKCQSKASDMREREIAIISNGLKLLAKELDCPVIVLAQLNRLLENSPEKRPKCSNLRESGTIEQDADLILLLYRDEVYDKNSPEKGIAEIIIGKNRHGPIGTVKVAFDPIYPEFKNIESLPQRK